MGEPVLRPEVREHYEQEYTEAVAHVEEMEGRRGSRPPSPRFPRPR